MIAVNKVLVLKMMNVYILIRQNCLSRSRWPRGQRRGSSTPRLLWLRIWIQLAAWLFVSCECCVVSGICLRDGPIARPEESYRVYLCHAVYSAATTNTTPAVSWWRSGIEK